MKATQITLAIAALFAVGQAVAATPVTPSDIVTARTGGTLKQTWFAGSSAFALPAFLAFEKLCDAGTMAIFDSNSSGTKPGSTGNYPTYACKVGTNVEVVYNNNGGSALAYAPFLPSTNSLSTFKGAALTRLAEIGGNTSCSTANGGSYTHVELKTGTTVSTPVYGSCATTTVLTDNGPTTIAGGITDVEAALFNIKSLKGIGTESVTNLGQTFGIVVNTSLYRALQAAQGITETGNNYDPTLAPSITREQYASITQSNETSFQTGWSNLLGSSYTSTPVYLIRRSADSGTQAGSQAFFLGNPCNNGNAGQISPATTGLGSNIYSTPNGDSFTVYESGSTGNVKVALTTLDNGGTITVDDGTGTGVSNPVTVTAGTFGIGVISLTEDWRAETTAANKGYRFIKIDGVSPEAGSATGNTISSPFFGTQNQYLATATTVSGQYPYYMESRYFLQSNPDAFGKVTLPAMITALDDPNTCALTPRAISLLNGISSCKSVDVLVTKNGNNCSVPVFAN